MAELKYAKNIITELKSPGFPGISSPKQKAERAQRMKGVLHMDDTVTPGAFYVDLVWFTKGTATEEHAAHTHDFDEFLTFWGTNPDDPKDLCGEIELWLEDEKHLITRSCLVFIPKGMKHCPLIVRRVDRPILHFAAGTAHRYSEERK
jgi:hypothetical protein